MLTIPQTKFLAYLSLVVVLLTATKMCRAEGDLDIMESPHKRGPTVGLFAFPRVGRSDPDLMESWADSGSLPMELADEYDDYQSLRESKRQGLVPFPRVGRSGSARYPPVPSFGAAPAYHQYWAAKAAQQKRASNPGAANSGMWFGPRLGKRAQVASSEIKGEQL